MVEMNGGKEQAGNTRRTYAMVWASFRAWSDGAVDKSATADPALVAAYLDSLVDRLASNSIRTHLTAIAAAYRARGMPIDTKHKAIAAALNKARARSARPARLAVPLVPKQLAALLKHIPEGPIGTRDRALLLVGFWLSMNLLELVKTNAESLVWRGEEIVLDGRNAAQASRSGRLVLRPCFVPAACPIRAVEAWLAIRGRQNGPLFPRILKGGKITQTPISASYLNLLTKRLAAAAGLTSYRLSGRSVRSGIAGTTTFSSIGARLRGVADAEDPVAQADFQPLSLSISADSSARWETRLGVLIDEISRLQGGVVSDRMKHLGTTRTQYLALSEISRANGLAQAELGRRLDLTKEGISGLVSRLVAGGWVVRQIDANDSRVRWIHLTDKACDLMHELRHISEEVTVSTFRNISEDVGHDLLRVLANMKIVLVALANAQATEATPSKTVASIR